MKKMNFFLFLMISLILNIGYAKMPTNLSCAKQAITDYYISGQFEKDVDLVVQDAEQYLVKRVNENSLEDHPKKLAIVLDIDDTCLSNYFGNKQRDFSGLPNGIEESYRAADAPPIKPVRRLYNKAIKNNLTVFFISFRPNAFRYYTIDNLHKAGYFGWAELFLPNEEEIKLPAQVYKTAIREMLTKKGYDIILSIGDQDSDLNGGYAEHVDKIPNPLYINTKVDAKICKLAESDS